MVRNRRPSRQMAVLLHSLAEIAPEWVHGYDLLKQTGLASGTLYPLLMRMEEQGLVSAEWRDPLRPGRPPRHAYRLTPAGVALALELADKAAPPGAHPA